MSMDIVEEIFDAFKGPTQLSRATGIKVQTVCDWRKKRPVNIPEWRRTAVLDAARRNNIELSSEAVAYLAQSAAA